MVESSHRQPPQAETCADAATKHKYHTKTGQCLPNKVYHRKRRRFDSDSATLPRNQHTSNSFEPFRSSVKYRNQKRRKSNSEVGNRKWVFSARDCSNYRDKVVVVSYNILGVENASKHPDLYLEVSPKFLNWDHRKELICEEVNHYNANILCFQEVDRFNDLVDLFQKHGYKGVYKGRTGDAYDGCAMFWKDKLFTLLHQENIDFQSFGLRHNVAQLCVLKMNKKESESGTCNSESSRSILIGNIHVLFNPNRGDIKLGQVRLFLEKAYTLSKEWGNIPVVIAGDLNSLPKSAMYQFLASSELDVRFHDRRKISGQLEFPSRFVPFRSENKNAGRFNPETSRQILYRWGDEELRTATGNESISRLQHGLNLRSAYFGVPGSSRTRDDHGEPLATSYHSKFMGTVDYIWHSEELVPVRVLETLPINVLTKSRGLPSEIWGSDHLALVCELAFAVEDKLD